MIVSGMGTNGRVEISRIDEVRVTVVCSVSSVTPPPVCGKSCLPCSRGLW